MMADDNAQYSDARVPCKICGRSFAPEVLAKHNNVCKKTAASAAKRKPFDSSKQRVIDGELSLKQIKQAQKKELKPPKSHWREKHQDFINAVRNARGVQAAIDSGGPLPPPPPPSINPDYIQCPYCSRRFSPQAADRHINFCKDQQARLPRSKPSPAATAKQNTRLNYQPPKPKAKTSPPAAVPPSSVPAARGGAKAPAPRGRAAPAPGRRF
ncbi:zinc finger C2HC domain-containing protein 1A-like isoform X1 [Biomphalaria glabrata]|uniref:Zinc finger C2HC domain-containing protein 1A-like isoform X1 n=1 Tax=Biomphalaria glabrata TaxID=6526 RepID=A0A9W2ZBU3_BIOGL|nr:zinc finger C2HC domain-containing protein 1A-like isoform X1 [Biomphalaria glabrata]KAI8727582.1 zinc finger C2HC domain-containing protein 1A-like; partial [Biomphalaria glabrata]